MSTQDEVRGEWMIDLVVITGLVIVAIGVLLSPIGGWPVEWLVGVPFLLFVPGYAIISALFPQQPARTPSEFIDDVESTGPDWIVRLILSVVLSAIIVGVIGVVLDWVLAIRLEPVVGVIGAVTVIGVSIAMGRRIQLPPERRANPFAGHTIGLRSAGTKGQTITLALAVLVLLGTVAFVGAVPPQGESYTESYLLNEDGELAADSYPSTFVAGEGHPISVGIVNHEHRSVTYEVVVVAQDIDPGGSVSVQQEIDRFIVDLDHGESTVVDRMITPTITGEDIRLEFLVYKDTNTDISQSPDQRLHLWTDVVDEPSDEPEDEPEDDPEEDPDDGPEDGPEEGPN